MTFKNVGVQCPFCGRMAHGIDATYDFVGNVAIITSAPPETFVLLQALQDALKATEAGADPDKVVAELEKVSPAIAKVARSATIKGGASALAGLLLALAVSCSASIKVNVNLDANQLADQAHVYMTGADPYPIAGQTASQPASPGEAPAPSRQQRRQLERQSKKRTLPVVQPSPRKPKR